MTNTITNKKAKTNKIIYWISTGLLALFILSGAFFMNSQMAIEGTRHLGLPEWFRWELNIGHIIGGLLLIIPLGKRIKEWNYVALGIEYISALIAHLSIDGLVTMSFSPLATMALLVVSYIYYHKLKD
ncbi:MAG: DoxX family protein [Ginsengibacter sp.]